MTCPACHRRLRAEGLPENVCPLCKKHDPHDRGCTPSNDERIEAALKAVADAQALKQRRALAAREARTVAVAVAVHRKVREAYQAADAFAQQSVEPLRRRVLEAEKRVRELAVLAEQLGERGEEVVGAIESHRASVAVLAELFKAAEKAVEDEQSAARARLAEVLKRYQPLHGVPPLLCAGPGPGRRRPAQRPTRAPGTLRRQAPPAGHRPGERPSGPGSSVTPALHHRVKPPAPVPRSRPFRSPAGGSSGDQASKGTSLVAAAAPDRPRTGIPAVRPEQHPSVSMPFPDKQGDRSGRTVYGRLHTIRPNDEEVAVARSDAYWGNLFPAGPHHGRTRTRTDSIRG
ncbi:hypothetical protein ACWEPB_35235 [Kitasatospora cineracea]